MGLFGKELANVVEWEEYRDDVIFWKWANGEIKKGSRLILRQGQDAIFMYNGKVEGIFKDEGSFDIESQIIPFLSTLKGFKFGFNSGVRAEVLFINTKEFTVKWGTKNPIAIPTPSLPGGMPIRAFGTFNFKINDYLCFIEKIAGIKQQYIVDEVRERVLAVLSQLLMKWISKEGKDMFNLQANAYDISNGMKEDLDMEISKVGLCITGFNIESFSYPEEVQKMQNKAASQSMVGDLSKYSQFAMTDAMSKGGSSSSLGSDMVNMQMGMMMGQQMMNNMNNTMNAQHTGDQQAVNNQQSVGNQQNPVQGGNGTVPKFCPNCGTPTNGAKFCSECGTKLV